ncbi:hypothetical protein [Cellulomonas hominis]|uniref:hypothetical protein n=1 Tax=Cellulomonas hominis TaxID=156981 RepID=UPI001BA2258C|nr:hypothetical protein [Cellulomonas hominis]VTR75800.1 hypothetical protein CHMI_00553 [Cellulomonas hominis]
MPDQPADPDQPSPEPVAGTTNPNVAFLPIGVVFLVLGLSWLANDSMRGASFAFIPVGVTFLVLSMRKGGTGGAPAGPEAGQEDQPGAGGEPGPDVTPR